MSKKLKNKNGAVVTFYSYKGGVGRSLALANIAVLLAQWGYKTLIIDWDLEAPGLENFFRAFIKIEEARIKPGLIDILGGETNDDSAKVNWKDCIIPIDIDDERTNFHIKNKLDIITSGNYDENYYERVRAFDFDDFYLNYNGGNVIENIRKDWKKEYDFILIDSRTGVTDIGGVCTIQLPDLLVLLFTCTDQGFNGIRRIVSKAIDARKTLPVDRAQLNALPIPTRMDNTETTIHSDWIQKFAVGLEEIYSSWLPKSINRNEFLLKTKIPYIPFYSFGEGLPVVEEGLKDSARMGYAYEAVAALIANRLDYSQYFIGYREDYVRLALDPEMDIEYLEIKENYKIAQENLKLRESKLINQQTEVEDNKVKIKKREKILTRVAVILTLTSLAVGLFTFYFNEKKIKDRQRILAQNKKDSLASRKKIDSLEFQKNQQDSIKRKQDSITYTTYVKPQVIKVKKTGSPIGIDIWHFNFVTDWARVKQGGISFILSKATEKGSFVDPQFLKNWNNSKSYNFVRGAYHVFVVMDKSSPSDQARNFIRTVTLQKGDLPPIIDVESPATGFETDSGIIAASQNVQILLDSLESHYKVKPIIYSYKSLLTEIIIHNHKLTTYPLWIASYQSQPPSVPIGWTKYTFWQFTENGFVEGINGNVNMDQFNGTFQQLKDITIK